MRLPLEIIELHGRRPGFASNFRWGVSTKGSVNALVIVIVLKTC
ncbi:hypothetical protein ACFL1S_04880 [Pseudomonadota bacterium]